MAYDTEDTGLSALTVSRLLEMAEYLESLPPERFDMSNWIEPSECGTVACIAGHIILKNKLDNYSGGWDVVAMRWLNLPYEETYDDLFLPSSEVIYRASNLDAAIMLRNLAATGKVNWDHVAI